MTSAVHPWRRFRRLTDWTLVRHETGPHGFTVHSAKVVSLRLGLTQTERRCAILHECLHAEHGPTLSGLLPSHELRVRKDTARLLMPNIKVVGDAIAWSTCNEEAAHELWVTPDCLRDRLRYLHPSERWWLRGRLAEVDCF